MRKASEKSIASNVDARWVPKILPCVGCTKRLMLYVVMTNTFNQEMFCNVQRKKLETNQSIRHETKIITSLMEERDQNPTTK